jgi:regulator of protease activity HflC (stomatin/prohibitin superfamily)
MGIEVTALNIIDFQFSEEFNLAIEAKVKAEQESLTQKNVLARKEYEAKQIIVTAQAQAEAIKIQAQAINSQ